MRLRIVVAALTYAASVGASEIRQFDIPTLERLGRELSRRDEIAAQASDLVAERPLARSLKMRGWITEIGDPADRVYLIAEAGGSLCLAYVVKFLPVGGPVVEDRRGEPLPEHVAVRFTARRTALEAVREKLFEVDYNMEVLDDPDGDGFLVYALAATKKEGEILTGGHFRVTVSADGSRAERADLLSHLILQPGKAGTELAAITASQVTSDVPVETWLYSSHLYRVPVYIVTMDGSFWRIVNGEIYKFSKAEVDAIDARRKAKTSTKKKKK
jgi:hypothetical protein